MKAILAVLLAWFAWASLALAAVDINSATEAELDRIKGVGPAKAKAIAAERAKNGPFKNLDEVAARVKGIGAKTVAEWKKSGSVVAGAVTAAPPPPAPKPAAPPEKK